MMGKFQLSRYKKDYPLKERVFLSTLVFFAVLCVVTVVTNLVRELDFFFNYKWVAMAIFAAILFCFALRRTRLGVVHRIGIYGLIFVILPLSWLSSSGLQSPAVTYSLLILIFLNYLTDGRERIILNVATIAINLALIALYRLHPEVFKGMTPHEQFLDWMVNVPVVFVIAAILLVAFEKAYEEERAMNEKKSEQLMRLSETDHLTGLYNRMHLKERLSFVHGTYTRVHTPYSIIIIDIDHFKEYNDHYGHLAGDQCLQRFGFLLKKRISRDTDWVCRYGGEEFLIILGFTDKRGAHTVADQIREDLAKTAIPHPGGAFLTVSMGIATVGIAIHNPTILLEQADEALYGSKQKGRNRITHFDDREDGPGAESHTTDRG